MFEAIRAKLLAFPSQQFHLLLILVARVSSGAVVCLRACVQVQLETPFSGGHAADLTNYSKRNGSYHVRSSGSHHRNVAVHGSAHGGSHHQSYATPHGSRHGGMDVAAAKDASATHVTAGGLYTNGQVSPAAKAGDQAV